MKLRCAERTAEGGCPHISCTSCPHRSLVEILVKLTFAGSFSLMVLVGTDLGEGLLFAVPPPPSLHAWRDWRGVCKNGLQNLERQGFRGQNLDYKRLNPFALIESYTAYALAMICFSFCEGKVRCHIELRKTAARAAEAVNTLPGTASLERCPDTNLSGLAVRVILDRILFLRLVEECFRGKQVADEGVDADGSNNQTPGYEEKPSSAGKK